MEHIFLLAFIILIGGVGSVVFLHLDPRVESGNISDADDYDISEI